MDAAIATPDALPMPSAAQGSPRRRRVLREPCRRSRRSTGSAPRMDRRPSRRPWTPALRPPRRQPRLPGSRRPPKRRKPIRRWGCHRAQRIGDRLPTVERVQLDTGGSAIARERQVAAPSIECRRRVEAEWQAQREIDRSRSEAEGIGPVKAMYSSIDIGECSSYPVHTGCSMNCAIAEEMTESLDLVRPLAFAGLVLATVDYFLLVRRRKAKRLESWERAREESNRRATARLRRIQRRDKV
jgi:hypothetical protein